jgi:outer membrane protein TolC
LDYIATGSARTPGVDGSGDDALAASITVTLPLRRNRYDAAVREAEAAVAQEQSKRDAQLNRVQADTVTALFQLRDAERQLALYETTLLPRAQESLLATQRAYSAGNASFADLIDTQRILLDFELSCARAITDQNQARIVLEQLSGRSLNGSAASGDDS